MLTLQSAINLCLVSEFNAGEFEISVLKYTRTPDESAINKPAIDSLIVSEFTRNYKHKPFYVLDKVSPNQILSYISPSAYSMISILEGNEKSVNSINTALATAFKPGEYIRFRFAESFFDKTSGSITGENINDTLKKYSYLMLGVLKDNVINIGSCFFLKKNKVLYLVGSYSEFTSWNTLDSSKIGSRLDPFPDTLALRLFRRQNHHLIYKKIDISKIKEKSGKRYFMNKPDLFFYKITDTTLEKDFEVNTIDDFVKNYKAKFGTPDSVRVVGYASSKLKSDGDYFHAIPQIFLGRTVLDLERLPIYSDSKKTDSINYEVDFVPEGGSWGAPAFFQVSVPSGNELKKINTFGGVYFSHGLKYPRGRIVRPEQLIKLIERLD